MGDECDLIAALDVVLLHVKDNEVHEYSCSDPFSSLKCVPQLYLGSALGSQQNTMLRRESGT